VPLWDKSAQSEFDDIRKALLSDPCLKRFDHRKRLYLQTDFCKDGFGWCASQPGNDNASLAAMQREMRGGDCEFMLPNSSLVLHPVAFGCRRTRGNETRLHSHLGEAYSGDYGINKCAHMCFGMQFTWITDCWALRFILTYNGHNPPLLRLQMRLMCWDMTIVHRPGTSLTSANYLSRLSADLCFDPFLKDYIQRVDSLKRSNPAISSLPIKPENMPGYRAKRKSATSTAISETTSSIEPPVDTALINIASAIFVDDSHGHSDVLSNVPIQFGSFDSSINLSQVYAASPLYNSDLVFAARTITTFEWAVYSFNNGHFTSSIDVTNCPSESFLLPMPTRKDVPCLKNSANALLF
jgi:hypothetical protein